MENIVLARDIHAKFHNFGMRYFGLDVWSRTKTNIEKPRIFQHYTDNLTTFDLYRDN